MISGVTVAALQESMGKVLDKFDGIKVFMIEMKTATWSTAPSKVCKAIHNHEKILAAILAIACNGIVSKLIMKEVVQNLQNTCRLPATIDVEAYNAALRICLSKLRDATAEDEFRKMTVRASAEELASIKRLLKSLEYRGRSKTFLNKWPHEERASSPPGPGRREVARHRRRKACSRSRTSRLSQNLPGQVSPTLVSPSRLQLLRRHPARLRLLGRQPPCLHVLRTPRRGHHVCSFFP